MNRNNTMRNLQYVSAIHLGIQCLEERNTKQIYPVRYNILEN